MAGKKSSRARASAGQTNTARHATSATPQINVKKLVQEGSFARQIDVPIYILVTILVANAISGSATLQSLKVPHSLQNLLPSWAHTLPQLSPYDSDVPNASHNSKMLHSIGGPFKSDAAGFGHPLTALNVVTRACLGLSYPLESSDGFSGKIAGAFGARKTGRAPWSWFLDMANANYTKGPLDLVFALTWALAWTAIRACVITYILIPLGKRWVVPQKVPRGMQSSKAEREKAERATERSIMRFAEQAWCVCYYIPSLASSIWVASRQPYWPLKTEHFWIGYPHSPIDGLTKFYYLVQGGFWVHQLLVLNLEARRKDYEQMFAHHIITIALISSSYVTNYHRIGNAILLLMDPSDILLSGAKCLRYAGQQFLCDVGFGLFVVSWIITRHVLFGFVIWSAATEPQTLVPRKWSWEKGYFFTQTFQNTMVGLLLALQAILLMWFAMIARVAWRVVTGGEAHDSRSDDESDFEPEESASSNTKAHSTHAQSSSRDTATGNRNVKKRR